MAFPLPDCHTPHTPRTGSPISLRDEARFGHARTRSQPRPIRPCPEQLRAAVDTSKRPSV